MNRTELDAVFATSGATLRPVPITCITGKQVLEALELTDSQKGWIAANEFSTDSSSPLLIPDREGGLARVLFPLPDRESNGPREHLVGRLPGILPAGTYDLESPNIDNVQAALAWGLGAYRFSAYRNAKNGPRAQLLLRDSEVFGRLRHIVSSVWLGRDLINRPANDLAPNDMVEAIRTIAGENGAKLRVWSGDSPDFAENFPLVNAVGAASTRPPQVAELTWGDPSNRAITLVGKGITFDTGGLDIKPASGMRYMKKDMGGAAAAIALARMIMLLNVPVRLKLIVTSADNAIAGNAFRPGDIFRSRSGLTVEIGNTDAEGRLVLADGLALADEEPTDMIVTFATLTGAARVALGPDLPAMFATDDELADKIATAGLATGDPVWRLPFWAGYDNQVDGQISDLRNVGDAPMAGAIFASLFLKRFVKRTRRYVHFDLYGWRASAAPLGPAGGEIQCARALLSAIEGLADGTSDAATAA